MTSIIIPRPRPVPMQAQFSGHFKLWATKPDGERRELAEFDNIITNLGLDRLAAGQSIWYCHVGTGSATPAVTDTALTAFKAATNQSPDGITQGGGSAVAPNNYAWYRHTFQFLTGVAAGTLTEIGIGWTAATGNLWSRALILDGGGLPTSITILADEVLNVSYEVRNYIPLEDVVGSVVIGGVTHDYIMRASGVGTTNWQLATLMSQGMPGIFNQIRAYATNIGPITGAPSGGVSGGPNGVWEAYVPGSRERVVNWSASLTQMNSVGGIRSIDITPGQSFGARQIEFEPKIMKDSTKVLTLKAKWSWARKTI